MTKAEIIKQPVEQIGGDVKKTAWAGMAEFLALIIFGILCVVMPETIVKVAAYIVGAFFLIKGGFVVIEYFMEKGQKDYYNNKLLSGIVSVLIGIAAFVIGEDLARVFSVIIGIIIIYEALVRINTASKLHAAGLDTWKQLVVISLIMLLVGIFVTFGTGGVVPLVGWMMVLCGVIGIVGETYFIQQINTFINKVSK